MSMRLVFASVLVPFGVVSLIAQEPATSARNAKANQQIEQAELIDAAPEPTDPVERALRATRNRLLNSPTLFPRFAADNISASPPTAPRIGQSAAPVGPPRTMVVDRFAPLPEFPVESADTIIIGFVSKVQPYLTEDGTRVYTEFSVLPLEIFKNAKELLLATGSVITLYQMGGAVRLTSGSVVHLDVRGLPAPAAENHRYVFFLRYAPQGRWYGIVKSWEIRDGTAVPIDPADEALAKKGRSQFAGLDERSFLIAVRDAVSKASSH
jgi:hypothetical protein